jgi:hypothetical protein
MRAMQKKIFATGSSCAGATFAPEAVPGREEQLMIGVRRVMLPPEEMRKL